jgi:hypothetical protein
MSGVLEITLAYGGIFVSSVRGRKRVKLFLKNFVIALKSENAFAITQKLLVNCEQL